MIEETEVPFDVEEEVILTDLDEIKETKQKLPKAQGILVRIEKPCVRKTLSNGAKDAPKEGPNNPWAYKYLNLQFRILEGIPTPVYDDNGKETGEMELKYKNKVMFHDKMDFVFTHNPEVKSSDWWQNKQYIFGFRNLCKTLGFETKEIKVNDFFLSELKDKEVLIDIDDKEEQELKNGEWVGKGTFKNIVVNLRKAS